MGDDDKNVPDHTKDALERYWLYGYEPGSFLTTLLCGQVFDAVGRADHWNKMQLGHIVYYIIHRAPRGSYGSPELVQDWIHRGKWFQLYEKDRVIEHLRS